ncbi:MULTISPECIES: LysE family translocator [unclassified Ruegeria]|uniref:LysE family translocator n=1 Tax=unclassified Ruegeria TaxID=2625375 RepID=UPI001492B296|nr:MULTISPECIES: LysE family translocator [unclassified Ruegeria]NOD86644.1 LysE family transporter [Ruegeria sp. HKCCD6119]
MMEISLLTFAFLALVVVLTPGPTVLLALSNGSRFGIATAGYGIAGAAISDAVLITAAGLGLGALLAASVFWFNVVKWIGVGYLVWLGVQMMRSTGQLEPVANPSEDNRSGTLHNRVAVFRKSFLVAVTNPKGYLFFTAFLPQFLTPNEAMFQQYATLAVVFIAVDVAVMATYAGLGAKAMHLLSDRGALWIDRTCGGLLITLGCALAFVRRSDV